MNEIVIGNSVADKPIALPPGPPAPRGSVMGTFLKPKATLEIDRVWWTRVAVVECVSASGELDFRKFSVLFDLEME
jgi:hypothetical protein